MKNLFLPLLLVAALFAEERTVAVSVRNGQTRYLKMDDGTYWQLEPYFEDALFGLTGEKYKMWLRGDRIQIGRSGEKGYPYSLHNLELAEKAKAFQIDPFIEKYTAGKK